MSKKISLFFLPLLLYAKICSYDIDIKLEENLISGKAFLDFNKSIELDPTKAKISSIKNGSLLLSDYPKYLKSSKKPLEIEFSYKTRPIMGTLMFLDSWYPKVEKRCTYNVKVDFGKYIPIMQYTSKKEDRFVFDKPLKNLYIIASKDFVVDTKKRKELEISTYFYKKDSFLSQKYIDKSFEYFDYYKKIFGFLPYPVFNIVEIPYPGGYSMATMSVIGEPIINKDFVLNESLGHEIVHQWFGNYVYSPKIGNWVEGLTTYYSDMLYAKNRGEGSKYRKNILIKYDSYVNKDNEITLADFEYKTYEDKNAVGYGKGAFFFYMLSNYIGEQNFNEGVRELLRKYRFKEATFSDLKKIFSKVSNKDLNDFFLQWVYRKGALDFHLRNIKLSFEDERYKTSFDLVSNEYDIDLPVWVCSKKECKKFLIDSKKTKHSLYTDFAPVKIVVDREYQVFRKLQSFEIPPVISEVLGSENLIVICDDKKKYKSILKLFKNVKSSKDVDYSVMEKSDLFILGRTPFLKKFAIDFKKEGDSKVEVFRNPLNERRFVLVFDGDRNLQRNIRLLKHLGKYSVVVFEGKNFKRYIKPSQKGAEYHLDGATNIVKVDVKDDFDNLIDNIKDSKVIFVGENHTLYSNHVNQLKIIKALYESGKKVAIGMEMFQQPFQKYLDLFIDGKISEKEMLKKTEYFKRWKYDYNLYRPIILYAKKHKIKIVALNVRKEISKKVAKEGIDALTKKEMKELPKSMDFTNLVYRQYMRQIYEAHAKKSFKNFENFFYAQVLWDETMADNIANFLKSHPDFQMVVLAGNGHLRFGYGIPDRIKRRGVKDYKIVLQNDKLKPEIADFILYPPHIDLPKEKKLGVYLKDDKTLVVDKVSKDSAASKAGLKKGDEIVQIDEKSVKNLADLRLELIFIKKCAQLKIKRDGKIVKKKICFEEEK